MTTQPESQHDDEGDEGGTVSRSQIRALEAKAKKADDLAAENQRLTRRETFRKAGIDPDDPKVKYFVTGYEGELESEAIRKEAEASGYLLPPEPTAEQTDSMNAGARIAQASAGARSQSAATEETVRAEMTKAFNEGGQEAAMTVARRYGAVSVEDYQ